MFLLLFVNVSIGATIYQLDTIDTDNIHLSGTLTTNGTTGDNLVFDSNLVIDWNIEVIDKFRGSNTVTNFNSTNSSYTNTSALLDITNETIALDLTSVFLQNEFPNGETRITNSSNPSLWLRWLNPVQITDPGFEHINPPSLGYGLVSHVSSAGFPQENIIATVVPIPPSILMFISGFLVQFKIRHIKAQ